MTAAPRHRCRMLGIDVIVSGSEQLLETMQGRLRYFDAVTTDAPADFWFEFLTLGAGQRHPIDRPAGERRIIGAAGDGRWRLEYFPAGDQVFGSYLDRVRLLCDPASGRTRISIAYPETENLWLATHPIFVIALFELLKRRGYFNIHAAGLAVNGRAILLAGHSGSGKSTLTLTLCRAGFDFLSDDYVFLAGSASGLRVFGFPEEVDVTDSTAAFFPEMASVLRTELRPGWTKRQIHLGDYWSVQPSPATSPGLLIFPRVGAAADSSIEPFGAREAVAELVSNIQLTRPDLAQAHLDLIGELVRSSASYRLNTGRDFERLPAMIRALAEADPDRSGSS